MTNDKFQREELEKAINESEFLGLSDKFDKDKYDTEKRKFLANIYNYVLEVYPITRTGEYNLEIVKVAANAAKKYKKEFGPFLHYFNRILSQFLKNVRRVRKFDELHGAVKVSNGVKLQIAQIARYAMSIGVPLTDKDKIVKIINELNLKITPEDFLEINGAYAVREVMAKNEDGEEVSVFDVTPDKSPNPEERAVSKDVRLDFLAAFENVYRESRESSKERDSLILSYILFYENKTAADEVLAHIPKSLLKDYSFINKRVTDMFYSDEKLTQKQLAELIGISAPAYTKAKNLLISRLKEEVKR